MCARPLVRVSWLHQKLKECPSNLRVLDGSWFLPKAKRDPPKEFLQKRIPGARYFDIDECRDKTSPYEHMIPGEAEFSKYVSNLGITNNSHVVVYDTSETPGVFAAPRVWWTLRVFGHVNVSVLEGGFQRWCAEGYPIESGPVAEESFKDNPPFKATLNPNHVCSYEFMMENIKSDNPIKVLDARPKGRFTGDEPEPRPELSSGHMPQSYSFPFAKCIDPSTQWYKDPEELKKMFSDANVDFTKPLITSCGSGVTGIGIMFAAFLCGKTDTRLYDGSWVEFVQRAPPDMIVKGEAN